MSPTTRTQAEPARLPAPPPQRTGSADPQPGHDHPLARTTASDAAPNVADMLRALEPDEFQPPPAYPVPWRIDRMLGTHPLVSNVSDSPLDFVRVFVDGERVTVDTQLWGRMLPGETAELCLCELDEDDIVVTLAWFRPTTGVEYVWRFVL